MPKRWVSQSDALEWIASNDRPERDDAPDRLAQYGTVRLVADLWRLHPARVAERVYFLRHRNL